MRIMPASRENISSTPSPLSALASVTTEMPTVLAHLVASISDTSRPSIAMVALWWVAALSEPPCSLKDPIPVVETDVEKD